MIGLSLRDVAFLGSLGLKEYFYLGGDFRYVYDEFGVNTAVPTLDVIYNTGAEYIVYTTAIQSDGKIIIGGAFDSYNGTTANRIARLHTNGSLDTSFVSTTGASGTVCTTAIQSDGKIIIGGSFSSYNGTTVNRVARLHTNGDLDSIFGTTTGASSSVYTTAIQSDDGKIIIGGTFTSYNGTTRNRIARLHTNGDLDSSFVVGTGVNSNVFTTSIQSDGKIIIGGQFTTYNGTTRNRIARLHTNGSLDTSFVVGSGASSTVSTTSIQSDGKIIIGGSFTSYNGTTRNRIARLHTNGSLDTSFVVGTGSNGVIYTTAIQSDGKIIIGGGFTSYNGTTSNYIARLHTNGSLDEGFDTSVGADNVLYTTAIQSDGKIIIGGFFTYFSNYKQYYISILEEKLVSQSGGIVKIKTDGSLYSSFNSAGYGYVSGKIKAISEQPNGDVIIAGENMVIDDENKVKSLVMLSKTSNIKTPYINTYGSINKILSVDDGT